MMQTVSVTEGSGLGSYLPGKLLQTAFSVTLSYVIQLLVFSGGSIAETTICLSVILSLIAVLFVFLTVKMKIRGRNPVKIGV